ncbi:MAG: hypothetical protein EG825_18365 [Rhodocyclaceae bacterium]|nr:hypothetical protein [Rhodocyclaceae bacterium]
MLTGWKRWIEGGALAMLAALAKAQGEQAPAAAPTSPANPLSGLGTPALIAIIAVAVVAVILYLLNRTRSSNWETVYSEPEPRNSKFEMLQAEIQGLTLRVSSGESKGYYRKVDTLCRVLLERMGFSGARKMSEEQINQILEGGRLPQAFSAKLVDIFARCRQGAVHESDKLDFSASELLKELRQLVYQVEETPQNKEA